MMLSRKSLQSSELFVPPPDPPITSLQSWWSMDDADVYGGQIRDKHGSNHMTLYGAPQSVAGARYQARSFDGVSDYGRLSGANLLNGAGFTLLVACYIDNDKRVRIGQGKDGYGSGWGMQFILSPLTLTGHIVTTSNSTVAHVVSHTPTDIAGRWIVAWLRFTAWSSLEIGYDTITPKSVTSVVRTGIRSSTFGWVVGCYQGSFGSGETVSPEANVIDDILLYNAALSGPNLQAAIDALAA